MGRGIIHINKSLFDEKEPPKGFTRIEDMEWPKLPQTTAEWHSFLRLPESYQVLGATLAPEYFGDVYQVLVENEAIPVSSGGGMPTLDLTMRQENDPETGKVLRLWVEKIEATRYSTLIYQAPKEH